MTQSEPGAAPANDGPTRQALVSALDELARATAGLQARQEAALKEAGRQWRREWSEQLGWLREELVRLQQEISMLTERTDQLDMRTLPLGLDPGPVPEGGPSDPFAGLPSLPPLPGMSAQVAPSAASSGMPGLAGLPPLSLPPLSLAPRPDRPDDSSLLPPDLVLDAALADLRGGAGAAHPQALAPHSEPAAASRPPVVADAGNPGPADPRSSPVATSGEGMRGGRVDPWNAAFEDLMLDPTAEREADERRRPLGDMAGAFPYFLLAAALLTVAAVLAAMGLWHAAQDGAAVMP